mgnify:FL=1
MGDEIDWILKNFFVRVGSIEGVTVLLFSIRFKITVALVFTRVYKV